MLSKVSVAANIGCYDERCGRRLENRPGNNVILPNDIAVGDQSPCVRQVNRLHMEDGMKLSGMLVGAMLVAGCAPMQSLEELESEAVRTGDWRLVEEREAVLAKRDSRRPMRCGSNRISYCDKAVGSYRCSCVSKNDVLAGAFR